MTDDPDEVFKRELVAALPHLRAFARGLSRSASDADDLAQTTMMKAWRSRAQYAPGSNLKAWLFRILRNEFYSEKRRSWRRCDLEPEAAESRPAETGDPDASLALAEVRRGLHGLTPEHREVLMLIGAAGLAYEEAAGILGCPAGTVKSRLNRAREQLRSLLDSGALPPSDIRPGAAYEALMSEVDRRGQAA